MQVAGNVHSPPHSWLSFIASASWFVLHVHTIPNKMVASASTDSACCFNLFTTASCALPAWAVRYDDSQNHTTLTNLFLGGRKGVPSLMSLSSQKIYEPTPTGRNSYGFVPVTPRSDVTKKSRNSSVYFHSFGVAFLLAR